MAKLSKPNQSSLRKGQPPKEEEASNNLEVSRAATSDLEKQANRPLNFKVPNAFRKRFKNYAVNHDISMSELLVSCFELYEQHHSKQSC